MIEELWNKENHRLEEWKTAPVPRLIAHIVDHYHLGARVEMARMETLAEEAVLLEGADNPELLALRNGVARFCKEFRAHMTMEEQTLFPYILDLALDRVTVGRWELMLPLKKLLEDEHLGETGLFRHLRGLSEDLAPPPGARALQTRLNRSFRALEKSLQAHIFLENQILFRRLP